MSVDRLNAWLMALEMSVVARSKAKQTDDRARNYSDKMFPRRVRVQNILVAWEGTEFEKKTDKRREETLMACETLKTQKY